MFSLIAAISLLLGTRWLWGSLTVTDVKDEFYIIVIQ